MVDRLNYFPFQPELHDWCNIGHDMYYHVFGMMDMKISLVLIRKGFPFYLNGYSI